MAYPRPARRAGSQTPRPRRRSLRPGVSLRTNAEGFRNLRDFRRLRYRRQTDSLDHHVHLFAFITDDLYRMREPWAWPWREPLLHVRDGTLILPERIACPAYKHPFLTALAVNLGELRGVELLSHIARRLGPGSPVNVDREIAELAGLIVADLAEPDPGGNTSLVLVHLPVIDDYGSDDVLRWRRRLRAIAAENRVTNVDLIAPFGRLPADPVSAMSCRSSSTRAALHARARLGCRPTLPRAGGAASREASCDAREGRARHCSDSGDLTAVAPRGRVWNPPHRGRACPGRLSWQPALRRPSPASHRRSPLKSHRSRAGPRRSGSRRWCKPWPSVGPTLWRSIRGSLDYMRSWAMTDS